MWYIIKMQAPANYAVLSGPGRKHPNVRNVMNNPNAANAKNAKNAATTKNAANTPKKPDY